MIVQKYGGSSLASPENIVWIAERIAVDLPKYEKIIVVVSAMGDSTDSLLSLAHLVSPQNFQREMDCLLSTGEQVSAALLSMALLEKGIVASSFNAWQLGILTDVKNGKARITGIDHLKISKALKENQIIVVTGFQGVNSRGDITTLGRGGSDTSAVALASFCDCTCQIYSDIGGIYSCDPNIVPGAKKFDYISYDHMLLLSVSGAEVLNPEAVKIASAEMVPLYCGSSFSNEKGTWVMKDIPSDLEFPDVIGVAAKTINPDSLMKEAGSFNSTGGDENPGFHGKNHPAGRAMARITVVGKRKRAYVLRDRFVYSLKRAGIRYTDQGIDPYRAYALINNMDSDPAVRVLARDLFLMD